MSIFVMSVAWQADLPVMEQHVLIALADHAWDDGSHVYPSVGYIAWKTCTDERTVQRNMRRLEARNILIPVSQIKGGRGKVTVYRINLDAIPLKARYGPIEEYTQAEDEKGGAESPFNTEDEKGGAESPFSELKGDSGALKGDSGALKGDSGALKGGALPPKPSLTIKKRTVKETYARAREEISFDNQKQKTETAERPRSMPAVESALRLPEVTPLPDPTPPIAPPPPAPPAESFGTEVQIIWMQMYSLAERAYGPIAVHQWLGVCHLYRCAPGCYVLTCRTSMQREMITTRFFAQLKMDLAACAREPMDSFEVRIAA